MESLISLTKTIDSLDDEDYRSFISIVSRRQLTAFSFKSLFRQLKDDCDQLQTQINELNDIVRAVLESKLQRDPAQITTALQPRDGADISTADPIKMDNLPDALLSEISSYLLFTDQLNFEKTDRSNFVGSRSSSVPLHHLPSNLLAKMVAAIEQNPQSLWWQNRLFKSVSIHWEHFGDWKEDNGRMYQTVPLNFMAKIHSLTIVHDSCFLDQLLESLVLNQSDTFPNLKRLKLFEEMSEEINFDTNYVPLKSLISQSSLEYLECNSHLMVDEKSIDEQHGCEWTKHLKGIAVPPQGRKASHCYQEKLHSAVELESLHFTTPVDDRREVAGLNGRLDHLKELCIGDGFKDFQFLLEQNIYDLKRLNLYGLSVQIEKMALWLSKVLESLEYFCAAFHAENWIVQIMEILQKALLQQNGMKKQLKIRFNYPTLEEISEFDKMMRILIGAMDRKCVDWMLVISGLELEEEEYHPAFEAALEALRAENEYDVMWHPADDDDDNSEFDIMIRNKDCKISGIQEKWIMDCYECRQTLRQKIFFR